MTETKNGEAITGDLLLDAAEAYANALRPVYLPEIKATVYAKLLTRADMAQLRVKYGDDIDGLTLGTVIRGIVNEDGEPMFTPGQKQRLQKMPYGMLDRMARAVLGQLDVEEQVKN